MRKETHNLIEYLKEFVVEERRKLFEEKIKNRTEHIRIVLENVFQGRNISASIRSADCFGIQNVHIIENDNMFNDDPEVSMGAEKWITIHKHNKNKHNSINAIKDLRSKGYQIIATTPHNTDIDLYDLNITQKKTALIFGSEAKGCSKETLKLADKRMRIPMYGFTESLNISVSAAIILQDVVTRLKQSAIDWKLSEEEKHEIELMWTKNTLKSSEKIIKRYHEQKKL